MNGLIRKLEKIFRREVKFNENKERMISDVIPVKIRVTKNTVYYF